MRERQSKILHANMCKVYLSDGGKTTETIVGGLQDLVMTFEYDNYYYNFIGGREARIGNPSIKGSFRQGILDFNLLRNMFFKTRSSNDPYININLNDYLAFHQNKIKLELLNVEELDDSDKTTTSKIMLREVIFNSLVYEIRVGSFILGNGTFMTDSIRFGSEQNIVTHEPLNSIGGVSDNRITQF